MKRDFNLRYRGQLFAVLSFVLASTLLLTGCQTVSTSHAQDIGVPRYAATDPALVQILRTPPARAHVRVGEVRAEPSSQNVDVAKTEAALRKEAAKLGADAAVVVYDHTQIVGAQVVGGWFNRSVELTQGRIVVAIAIKHL
jgi:hypothetical protein